jgi:hypothetical protein
MIVVEMVIHEQHFFLSTLSCRMDMKDTMLLFIVEVLNKARSIGYFFYMHYACNK